jgi:hypothetical protein
MTEPSIISIMDQIYWAQECARGFHAWLPWLALTNDDGVIRCYVTFCSRCKHEEQYEI